MQNEKGIANRGRRNLSSMSVALAATLLSLTVSKVPGQRMVLPDSAQQQKTIASLKAHPKQVNKYDANGYTPLMRAARDGELLVVRYLLQHGAHVGLRDHAEAIQNRHATALDMALARSSYDIAEVLLQGGAKIDSARSGITLSSDMSLPVPMLSEAARSGDLTMIRFLAKHGANMDAVDEWGNVPLFYSDTVAVANALISCGAHVNPVTKGANSLLDSALESTQSDIGPQFYVTDDIIAVFLKAGATSREAMCLAASRTTIAPLQQMLNQGWNPDRRNRAGLTPLMVAISERRSDVVRLLLAHKARVDLRSPQGKTALMLARKSAGHRAHSNAYLPEPSANKEDWQEGIRLLQGAGEKE